MKAVYTDIQYKKQIHRAGICQVQITPREWLAKDPVIDFETGRVLEAVELKSGKFWLVMELVPRSYDFDENMKASKSGDLWEVSLSGVINTYNFSLQQVLENVRYSELVAVVYDRNQRRKIVGNTESGLKMMLRHTQKNNPHGEERVQIDLSAQFENAQPFYNPDNSPEQLGNYLINNDGNFLLIE